MIKRDRPSQEAEYVFTTCISRVRDVQLKARLESVTQAVVDASAECDDAVRHTRLHQIAVQVLGLGRLYAAEAADELLNIRHQIHSLHASGGAALVQVELQERAESCQEARRNGWRAATYGAFANSDWFCDGGFAA